MVLSSALADGDSMKFLGQSATNRAEQSYRLFLRTALKSQFGAEEIRLANPVRLLEDIRVVRGLDCRLQGYLAKKETKMGAGHLLMSSCLARSERRLGRPLRQFAMSSHKTVRGSKSWIT